VTPACVPVIHHDTLELRLFFCGDPDQSSESRPGAFCVSQHAGLHREHIPIFRNAEVPDFQNLLSRRPEKSDHVTRNEVVMTADLDNHGVSTTETPFPSTLSPTQLSCSNVTPRLTELTPGDTCRECAMCLYGEALQLKTFSTTYLPLRR